MTRQILQRYTYLKHYFAYKQGKLIRLYVTPTYFGNLRSQYSYFQSRCYQSIMFFQVGCFYEFYGKQALRAHKHLKLTMIAKRYGFTRRCGIGVRALDRYVELALKTGFPVVVIKQTGYQLPYVAERTVAVKYIP